MRPPFRRIACNGRPDRRGAGRLGRGPHCAFQTVAGNRTRLFRRVISCSWFSGSTSTEPPAICVPCGSRRTTSAVLGSRSTGAGSDGIPADATTVAVAGFEDQRRGRRRHRAEAVHDHVKGAVAEGHVLAADAKIGARPVGRAGSPQFQGEHGDGARSEGELE